MSQKAINEFDSKRMLVEHFDSFASKIGTARLGSLSFARVSVETDIDALPKEHPWLLTERLVAKPDQLIKARGKANLLALNKTWDEVKAWINERRNKEITIGKVTGVLTDFLVERFVPHEASDELYVSIVSCREGDEVLFYHEGGIEIGDVDSKAEKLLVAVDEDLDCDGAAAALLGKVSGGDAELKLLGSFIASLFAFYRALNFAYLEINPLVVKDGVVIPLDFAGKLDQTAEFLSGSYWGDVSFPPPFGRSPYPEEKYIQEMDSKTGSSLKLTVLNPAGRIWTLVAGGGASVVYADAIADLGAGSEMANYGEYSGDPGKTLTFEYAKTVIGLAVRGDPHPDGKVLIVGGGIANFTDVAQTFRGIIMAIEHHQHAMRTHNMRVYVRRGGPNYQQGLANLRDAVRALDIPIEVYGPDTHITSIVSLALGYPTAEKCYEFGQRPGGLTHSLSSDNLDSMGVAAAMRSADKDKARALSLSRGALGRTASASSGIAAAAGDEAAPAAQGAAASSPSPDDGAPAPAPAAAGAGEEAAAAESSSSSSAPLFSKTTKCIVFGMQVKAVQRMLDFDYISDREPSVVAVVYPFAGDHYRKFHWGAEDALMPIYEKLESAVENNPDASVLINFSSFRAVYETTLAALNYAQLRTIALIAEGVPEYHTKLIIKKARAQGVTIIGPATVGGIKAGCFRIANTGGAIDNIIASKLYRAGSVAYVSKSGGMSNELNNIINKYTDGVAEGVAIGGDRYPATTFIDHIMRFHDDPDVAMLVLLGEVGGTEEYKICQALKDGRITKPLVAWCVGTCAKLFPYEVQFGHAGAVARQAMETADSKNAALKLAGAHVPPSFEQFGKTIGKVFRQLVDAGAVKHREEPPVPQLPMDFDWAQKLGLIRKPANFISTITDDRGEELLYAGMPISKVFAQDLGIGGVLSLLWFKRRLPDYACKFIEMTLMVTADHGPAVSGAHNTIVTARAGKDLISSLCSGLLTIGPRFGGAVDAAAQQFGAAVAKNQSPADFVRYMRSQGQLIMGIGHKVKSTQNPDLRVSIIKEFAQKHFPTTTTLDFALGVERITTKKRNNLILNVDGCIGVCFVDLLYHCGAFSREEAKEYLEIGCLNGLFVLGRTIGFIGHYLDQKRLKQALYRHDTDDISYFVGV